MKIKKKKFLNAKPTYLIFTIQLVQKAILIFKVLHPRCISVFCFDQSTNHNAIVENVLITIKMNLGPEGKQPRMHDGWYINEYGDKCIQPMIFPNDHLIENLRGKSKKIKKVLEKRNLWSKERINLVCKKCSEKNNNDLTRQNCYA